MVSLLGLVTAMTLLAMPSASAAVQTLDPTDGVGSVDVDIDFRFRMRPIGGCTDVRLFRARRFLQEPVEVPMRQIGEAYIKRFRRGLPAGIHLFFVYFDCARGGSQFLTYPLFVSSAGESEAEVSSARAVGTRVPLTSTVSDLGDGEPFHLYDRTVYRCACDPLRFGFVVLEYKPGPNRWKVLRSTTKQDEPGPGRFAFRTVKPFAKGKPAGEFFFALINEERGRPSGGSALTVNVGQG